MWRAAFTWVEWIIMCLLYRANLLTTSPPMNNLLQCTLFNQKHQCICHYHTLTAFHKGTIYDISWMARIHVPSLIARFMGPTSDPSGAGRTQNMGPIRGRQDPDGPHVGPMNFAVWAYLGDESTCVISCFNDKIWMNSTTVNSFGQSATSNIHHAKGYYQMGPGMTAKLWLFYINSVKIYSGFYANITTKYIKTIYTYFC